MINENAEYRGSHVDRGYVSAEYRTAKPLSLKSALRAVRRIVDIEGLALECAVFETREDEAGACDRIEERNVKGFSEKSIVGKYSAYDIVRIGVIAKMQGVPVQVFMFPESRRILILYPLMADTNLCIGFIEELLGVL